MEPSIYVDPGRPPPPSSPSLTAVDPAREPRGLPGVRALVVDDEVDAREMIATFLGLAGMEVQTAASVADAMNLLTTFRPDVVLCDLSMPGEDGYSFIRRFRAKHELHDVPVVALTAHAMRSEREYSRRAGFDGHLGKPADPHLVLTMLASLLHR